MIELLVVTGIIALLIGILLPVAAVARRSAADVKCKSNMRQVCAALLNYAAENKGKFPPNIDFLPPPAPNYLWNSWYDAARIGRYLPRGGSIAKGLVEEMDRSIGGVLACPADEGGSASYAMNYFASSAVRLNGNTIGPPNLPLAGKAWSTHSKRSAQLILLTEMLSTQPDEYGTYMSWGVHPTALRQQPQSQNINAIRFVPGFTFVGYGRQVAYGGGSMRYQQIDTEFDWARHRRRGDGGMLYTEARGRANFGFADGHVEGFTVDQLADRRLKRSKLVALWSPLDSYVDRLPRPNF